MYPEISNNDIIDKQQISSNDNQVLEILQKNKLDTIKDTVDYNKNVLMSQNLWVDIIMVRIF